MHHHQPNVQRSTARRVIKFGLFSVIFVVTFHHLARTDDIEITNEEDVKFGRKGKVGSENVVVLIDNDQKMYNEEFESFAKENLYVQQVKNEKVALKLPSESEREFSSKQDEERNDSEEAAHTKHEVDESGNKASFHTDNVEPENTLDSRNDVETASGNANGASNKGQDEENNESSVENKAHETIDEDQITTESSESNENRDLTDEEIQALTLNKEEVPKRKIVELQNDNSLSYLKLKGIDEPSPIETKADSAQEENSEASSTDDKSKDSVSSQSEVTESNNYKSIIENLLDFTSFHSKVAESNNDEHKSATEDSSNSEAGSTVSTSEDTPNSNDDTMTVDTNNAGGVEKSADDDIKNKDTGIDGTSVVIVFSDQSTTYAESSIDEAVLNNREEF